MVFLNDEQRREFEATKPEALQADIWMISGCEDHQTSADVSNVTAFELPDPSGRAGGACTATLLNVLYEDEQRANDAYTFTQVLEKMRIILQRKGFTQVPQLSSTRPIDMNETFKIVPDTLPGTRRAVLIGINYKGQKGALRGCHNDVFNMVSLSVSGNKRPCSSLFSFSSLKFSFPLHSIAVQLHSRLLWI
jgi:hypothetical protein